MPSKLSGKVAIVTGASKRIGAEISRGLAAEGASVLLNYSSRRPMAALCASSKAAINSLTRTMALELGSRKIRVNAIAPGHTKTEGTDSISLFEGEGAALANASPFKRFGQPQDIARVAVFLASDDSAWITGEVIRVSCGTI